MSMRLSGKFVASLRSQKNMVGFFLLVQDFIHYFLGKFQQLVVSFSCSQTTLILAGLGVAGAAIAGFFNT